MATQMSEEVKQFIKGLNRLAMLYETHPELPVPGGLSVIYAFVYTREEMVKATKAIAHLKPKKGADPSYYSVEAELSSNMKLQINVPRGEVCERVQVGVKLVEVPARPAVEAHVEEVPQYEWKCNDSLLAPGVTPGTGD